MVNLIEEVLPHYFILMRNFIKIFVLIFTLQSCSSVTFSTHQPEDAQVLKEFPAKIQGIFSNSEDTLVVEQTSFIYDGGEMISLSGDITPPDVVLKKMDNWYFLNIKDEGEWWIYPFQISGKNKITVYYSNMEDNEQKIIEEFKDLKVQKIIKEGKLDHYLVSPTPSQFKKLLKKRIFSENLIFKRIN